MRLLRLNLLESEIVLLKVVSRETSAFGHFIYEFKGCVNTWMTIVDVLENRGKTYRKLF